MIPAEECTHIILNVYLGRPTTLQLLLWIRATGDLYVYSSISDVYADPTGTDAKISLEGSAGHFRRPAVMLKDIPEPS